MSIAYITVITNETYFKGLKTLIKTLKCTKTTIPIYVMLPHTSDNKLKETVKKLGVKILECNYIDIDKSATSSNPVKHWNDTFFKLNLMRLTQFDKIVYIDADMIVLKNIDHLFDYPSISATTGGKSAHPEYIEFNSGIMVLEPSITKFEKLISCIEPAIERREKLGYGFGDQDVFNEFYPQWHEEHEHDIGELHNAIVCFLDELTKKHNIKSLTDIYVLHYIGAKKIWQHTLFQNIKHIYGCLHNKKIAEAKAILLYLIKMYFN